MSSKANYILGAITISVVIGGTIYAIKKYKDQQKEDEGVITLEEARAMVKQQEEHNKVLEGMLEDNINNDISDLPYKVDMEEVKNDIREEAGWNASFMPREDLAEAENVIPLDIPFKDIMTEEDKILRYEQNSIEARRQFINMELAEWDRMDETYTILRKLFDFPFVPKNDGDHMTMTQIIDYRVKFFGFGSKWCKEVTYADLILYYAKRASYELDDSIRHWVEYIIECNEFESTSTSKQIGELLDQLNAHTYYNQPWDSYGIFGLERAGMDSALHIASMNIDQCVTYEIEFQEFLKQSMM